MASNDDFIVYLKEFMVELQNLSLIKDYKISYIEEYKSYGLFIDTEEVHKEALYDIFSEMPLSFNSQVITYLK